MQKRVSKFFIALIILASFLSTAYPQSRARTTEEEQSRAREISNVSIESKGITISYLERKGATEVGFRYPNDPENLQQPRGTVKVERKGGYCEIDVQKKFDLPGPASDLYLYFTGTENGRKLYPKFDIKSLGVERFKNKFTYVFWVVTTNGITENLGEVLFRDDLGIQSDARAIDVTTRQPIFAMMITAEPHAYVTTPSDAVVLVNYGQFGTFTSSKGTPVSDELQYVPRKELSELFQQINFPFPDNANLKFRHRQTRSTLSQARAAVEIAERAITAARKNKELDPRTPDTLVDRMRQRLQFSVSDEIQSARILDDARDFLASAERDYGSLVNDDTPSNGKDPLRPIVQKARNANQLAQEATLYADIATYQIAIRQKDALISLLVEEDLALKERIRQLEAENSGLRDTIRRLEAEIRQLNITIQELNNEIDRLKREIARYEAQLRDLQARILRLEQENARLNGELKRICNELRKVIDTLGDIEQQGTTVTVRLKSDVLFPEAVYILAADRDLNKDVRPRLAQLALLLQILFRDARFQFIGHTDTVDTDGYNQWLSEQRALEVMRFFYQARLQVMSSDDLLRSDYQQKIQLADRLLGPEFPEWKPKSRPGGIGDQNSKMEKFRQQRQDLLLSLSSVVQGRGELEPRVSPETTEEHRQLNRRVEIKIELPPESSFEYCNPKQ
ncbi:MAG: hypothetical protein JNN15_06800 [Blastocatellia bacterium]|nr:hypothetical protein [Blastocatellia bacterium]